MIDRSGKVYKETKAALLEGCRLVANIGGTRSGKTFSVCALLVDLCFQPTRKVWAVDIVSESMPHLKRGAIEDVGTILSDMGFVEDKDYELNRSDHVFTFKSGNRIRDRKSTRLNSSH